VPAAAEPTEAPPAPREENQQPRAGFVWIHGRWDWKANKWDWVPGHWERERAGKKWREARWENQGGHWKLVDGEWVDGSAGGTVTAGVSGGVTVGVGGGVAVGTPPPVAVPPPGDWPTQPPPPPQTEAAQQPRAGFVWIPGQWDWKAGKYNWVPGHWERERAGKRWRESKWEQQNGKYVRTEGDWVDVAVGEAPVPPPAPAGGEVRDHRHEWKVERPTVSSYWPAKGKAGTKVTIRGVYFPADTTVFFAGKPVMAASVSPVRIVFQIPNDATAGGAITLHRQHGRDLMVGSFDVAAGFDAAAEQKRLDDERRKAAEAAWAAHQKELAADRAARAAAIEARERELAASREQRREQRAAEIRAKWDAAFLADPDTQDELTLHAQRVAELVRMKEMAELSADAKLGVRIDLATQREQERHDQRMQALHTGFTGGAK
jgi:hypothetical protein